MIYPGIVNIGKSKITKQMFAKVTLPFIESSWLTMLSEVSYAACAINMIERRQVYEGNKLLVDSNDSVIKPDHTAARGFVDSSAKIKDLQEFDPAKDSLEKLQDYFIPITGTAFSVLVLQMLGADIADSKYNFSDMYAVGTNLFFVETGNVIADRTKHFVSNQDIAKLPDEYRQVVTDTISQGVVPISDDDWQSLQAIYLGGDLSDNDIKKLNNGLDKKVFSRFWQLDESAAKLLCEGAKTGKKYLEYAYSTLLRGGRLNHGTWRVADIYRGYGILASLGTNPVAVRAPGTMLEQTAGMAVDEVYKTSQGADFTGPGAFLELASRPYMLLSEDGKPVDKDGKKIDINASDASPVIFHEVEIQFDVALWVNEKSFIDYAGREVTLGQIDSGMYGKGTRLVDRNGHAFCYEGFKEANAKGIFFAAGGILKDKNNM